MKYTKLEYIESTGTQYIDTGVKFGTGFACDIKFNMLSTSGDIDLLSSGVDENYLLVSYLNGTPRIYLNSSAHSRDITMPYNTIHTVNMNYNGTTLTYKVDDTTTYTLSASNLAAKSNLLLFARYATYGYSKAILYYCKIYNNGILIRDFIPCKYNGKIGLLDRVSETFFANNGTGEFVAGPKVGPKTLKVKTVDKNNLYKKLQYIQSSRTQYIDTGVKFTTGFSCDIKFNMLSTSGDIDILSSAQNDNYLLVSYLNGTPRIYLNGTSKNITMPYNTVHTVNMNYNGSTLTYTVDNTTTYTVSKSNATANSNLLLFARSSSYGFSKAVLYYCKIWNGNILVRDLIPVEKASDNTICLYDLVSNTFLENSGTGKFIAGPYSLIGKTVSKINGKYAKTINGVSIQCWKKKYE